MAERADYYPDTDVPVASWLGDAAFINAAGTAISQSKVTSNELIGVSMLEVNRVYVRTCVACMHVCACMTCMRAA